MLAVGCTNKEQQYPSFSAFMKQHRASKGEDCAPKMEKAVFHSKSLDVDGLAKSMTGDIDDQKTSVDVWNGELIWVTGAQVSMKVSSGVEVNTRDEFLCHSLVNLHQQDQLPWKIPTKGTDKRFFTFSQGINAVQFPEGFALPLWSTTKLSIGNQVLNLNRPDAKAAVQFTVSLDYFRQQENCSAPKALYQQPVFVTKKTAGPAGPYNATPNEKGVFRRKGGIYMDTAFAQCGIRYEEGYHPYYDNYGRTFTAHWSVSQDTLEVLATNVTPMLDLKKNTRIHSITMHVHPYAKSLTLLDKTSNTVLFEGQVQYKNNNYSLIHSVDSYSSNEGIPVFKNHEYQLISVYRNPNRRSDITAMATLFLYLAE